MKEFRCNEDCELFKGNCGKHHIDYQGHIVWDCPHEQYYMGVLGDIPSCFRPSKEFKEKQRLNKQITIGEMESILNEIKVEIDIKYGHCDICEYFEDYDYEENDISEYRPIGDIADILQIIDKYKVETEVEE